MNTGNSEEVSTKRPLVLVLLLLSSRIVGSQKMNLPLREVPENWSVKLDISSVESIVKNPERILKNTDAFWQNNNTLRVVRMWHNLRRQPINYDEWKRELRKVALIPPEKRQNNAVLLLAQKIAGNQDAFFGNAIEHIDNFLPKHNLRHTSTVYLTANINVSGFAVSSVEDHVVINISDPYWQGDYTSILNAIVHELFHTGYNTNQVFRTEVDITNSAYHNLLTGLHNEGMATYVAYTAQAMFPAPAERDFKLLERLSEVRKRLKMLNSLFSRAESLSPEELRMESWKTGVEERAYYVVGGFMAKTIDKKIGRDELAKTIRTGPRHFIDSYNSLVEERMEVCQLAEPAGLTTFQRLRKAAVERDYNLAERLVEDIRENKERTDGTSEYTLNFAGSALRHRGNVDLAFEVLRLSKRLFPASIASLYGLADIHLKRGETDEAIACYEEIAREDPFPLYAEKMLDELKGK